MFRQLIRKTAFGVAIGALALAAQAATVRYDVISNLTPWRPIRAQTLQAMWSSTPH